MDELGDGDGLGDLLDELGDGEGDVELDELTAGEDELLDGDFAEESEVLGVADGLALGEADVDAPDDADLELLGEADLLPMAVPLGDTEAEADSLALLLRYLMVAAVSTAPFGGDEHAACGTCEIPAPTASAPLIRLPATNKNPVSTPSAAGRTISALTGTTSLRSAPRAGSPLLPP